MSIKIEVPDGFSGAVRVQADESSKPLSVVQSTAVEQSLTQLNPIERKRLIDWIVMQPAMAMLSPEMDPGTAIVRYEQKVGGTWEPKIGLFASFRTQVGTKEVAFEHFISNGDLRMPALAVFSPAGAKSDVYQNVKLFCIADSNTKPPLFAFSSAGRNDDFWDLATFIIGAGQKRYHAVRLELGEPPKYEDIPNNTQHYQLELGAKVVTVAEVWQRDFSSKTEVWEWARKTRGKVTVRNEYSLSKPKKSPMVRDGTEQFWSGMLRTN